MFLHSGDVNKSRSGLAVRIFLIVLAVAAVAVLSVWAYLDTRPWLLAGNGIPHTIYLRDGYRIERVLTLRRGYHVDGVADGGQIVWSSDSSAGAVMTDGSGNVTVLHELPDVPPPRAAYCVIADTPDGRAVYEECCDIGGLTVMTGEKLGVMNDDDSAAYLFPSDEGGSWSLDEPRVYGDFIVARIYYCDTVYRLVGQAG